ncbi:MAG: hypothetical protein DRH26_07005 [Deltaproteobacteria bacterium]|nr:MAG: hypothetical protein DRH26_07005 [Deltaproteobacteria bacterium]
MNGRCHFEFFLSNGLHNKIVTLTDNFYFLFFYFLFSRKYHKSGIKKIPPQGIYRFKVPVYNYCP